MLTNKEDEVIKRIRKKTREIKREIKDISIRLDKGWFQGWSDDYGRRTLLNFNLELLQGVLRGTKND